MKFSDKEIKQIKLKFGLLQDEREAAKQSMTPFGAAKHALCASEIAEELLIIAFKGLGVDVYGG